MSASNTGKSILRTAVIVKMCTLKAPIARSALPSVCSTYRGNYNWITTIEIMQQKCLLKNPNKHPQKKPNTKKLTKEKTNPPLPKINKLTIPKQTKKLQNKQ